MITIKNLNFSYSRSRPLFTDLDLSLQGGRIYGLLGKNGAGKSTLLKNIAGLVYPQGGSIAVLGKDPSQRSVETLQQISFIPEEFHLPAVKSDAFVKANSGFYPEFDHQYFKELIQEFAIPVHEQRLADMSYGQKKKYIISFGLASRTKLIIMDEPTNGLDIPSKAQFRKVMASALTDDRCFIISTHQVRDLDNLIDTVIILNDRKVVMNATIDQLANAFLFRKMVELPSTVIYAEQAMGGYNTISVNHGEEHSKVDLELLFNAVLEQKIQFENLLNTSNNEQYA
ncbi:MULTISPECIES: ATP-binding cassette domain-containing protein [Sphingobacterium]|uniref:ABC transporter ATP-binding protein n=1 Tax=Sphingobacterium TaxID=28453 RepID=UPI0013DB0E33|nr:MULTISPECIES: ABC transporter ATP-binding protein [unclassified Sphingobacterium]